MKKPPVVLSSVAALTAVILFVFGFCFNCFAGIEVYTSSDGLWNYTIVNTDQVYICSGSVNQRAYLGDEKDIIIPAFIDGHRVFGIGKYAFSGIDGITSVSFPKAMLHNNVDFEESTPSMAGYYCYKGSTSDKFARQNSFLSSKMRYIGDVNADGAITLDDYSLVLGYLADESAACFDTDRIRTADYDSDTAVDAFDLFFIGRVVNAGASVGSDDDESRYAIIEWG